MLKDLTLFGLFTSIYVGSTSIYVDLRRIYVGFTSIHVDLRRFQSNRLPGIRPEALLGHDCPMVGGALPPKPPGMSAANQAASIGIDFQQGHRLRIEDFPMGWVSVISTNGETFE